MKQKDLASALGISEAMVSKLKRRGMPVDSIERAARWRRRHLEITRTKGVRMPSVDDAPRPGRPALPPALPRQPYLVAEFLRVAGVARTGRRWALRPLPAPVLSYLRGLLLHLTDAQFEQLADEHFDVLDACFPESLLAWSSAGPDNDESDDWGAGWPRLVRLAAAGATACRWDGQAPRPAFVDAFEVAAGPEAVDLVQAAREFELWRATCDERSDS
jgi:transcriptional regulator with XRE-family HTH domain